jgi:hypothetical protein
MPSNGYAFEGEAAMRVRLIAGVAAVFATAGVWAQVPPVPKPAQPQAPAPQIPGQTRDAQAQSQAPQTAVIMGTVLIGGTGQPADGVRLTLNGIELRGTRSAISDDNGKFAFLALPAGTYTLRATKLGYVSASYGQKQPGRPGTSIVLAVGQQLKDITLEVPKGGVVSGTVYDEKNRPAVTVPVRLLQWTWQSGERVMTQVGSGTTDDRGIYRIFGLAPGDYVVNATPRNTSSTMFTAEDVQSMAKMEELMAKGLMSADSLKIDFARDLAMPNATNDPVSGYATMYYPGTPQPGNATAVKVGVSQEQLGIDFQLQRVSLSKVTGTVIAPTGVNTQNVQVRLVETGAMIPGMQQFTSRPNPQGIFTFSAVPPGQYQLMATVTVAPARQAAQDPWTDANGKPLAPAMPAQPMQIDGNSNGMGRRLWAVQDLTVDGNFTPNVSLTLQEGMTITGSVSFDGAAAQPQLNRMRVTLVRSARRCSRAASARSPAWWTRTAGSRSWGSPPASTAFAPRAQPDGHSRA